MKAYNIMMFILVFNLFLWIVTIGIGIYDLSYSGISPEAPNDATTEEKENALLSRIGGTTLAVAVGSIVSGAIIGSILKVEKASQAFVYGAITSVFWITYLQSVGVFWNISSSVPGGIIILILITAVIAYVFLVGLFQMVTGGWKSYV